MARSDGFALNNAKARTRQLLNSPREKRKAAVLRWLRASGGACSVLPPALDPRYFCVIFALFADRLAFFPAQTVPGTGRSRTTPESLVSLSGSLNEATSEAVMWKEIEQLEAHSSFAQKWGPLGLEPQMPTDPE